MEFFIQYLRKGELFPVLQPVLADSLETAISYSNFLDLTSLDYFQVKNEEGKILFSLA